jgi:hypothetical protein
MEICCSISIGPNQQVTVYRFHSTYIHEQLNAYWFDTDVMVEIQLSGQDYSRLREMIGAMQAVAQTLRIG